MIICFILAALSADGYIAREASQISTAWTGPADKKRFVELSKRAGVVIMGLNTFNTIGKPLPKRLNIIYAPAGTPAIPGTELTDKDPAMLLQELESRGFKEVAICGGSTIYTMFMKAGVVNKLYLTIEPVVFGKGLTLFKEEINVNLKLESSVQTETGALLQEYSVVK